MSTTILLLVGIVIYGLILRGWHQINREIMECKGSSGAKLRSGIFLLILRYGSLCPSQIAVMLKKPLHEIKSELDYLRNRKIIKKKKFVAPQEYSEPVWIIGEAG